MLPQYGFRVIYYNIIRGFNNLNTESGGGNGPGDDAVVGRAVRLVTTTRMQYGMLPRSMSASLAFIA